MYPPPDRSPFKPITEIYMGEIHIDSQPRTWIKKHLNIANEESLRSRIRYSEWIPDKAQKGRFLIYAPAFEGKKQLTIVLKIQLFEKYTLVYHAHVLRNK
jgi:hypothetical protein